MHVYLKKVHCYQEENATSKGRVGDKKGHKGELINFERDSNRISGDHGGTCAGIPTYIQMCIRLHVSIFKYSLYSNFETPPY